jgi:phosphoserine phosphatase
MDSVPTSAEPVLCVDLDGTISRTDLMVDSGIALLKRRPWLLPMFALWQLRGRAALKQEIAKRVAFDPTTPIYNRELLDWLKQRKASGAKLVLASGADRRIVERVASHLGLFDEIFASDGNTNLTGANKAAALVARFPDFAYVGNSRVDLAVWRRASRSYLVAKNSRRAARLGRKIKFARVFRG